MLLSLANTSLLLADGNVPSSADDLWKECEGLYLAAPKERDSVGCFQDLTQDHPETLQKVVDRLIELRAEDRDNPWLPYYQASILWPRRDPEMVPLYGEAAEIARRVGDLEAAFEAIRWRVRFLLDQLGDAEEAHKGLAELESLAAESGRALFQLQFEVEFARSLTLLFGDLEQARYLLYRAERENSFDTCRPRDRCEKLERSWLHRLVTTIHALGLYEEEKEYLKRLEASTPENDLIGRAALAYRWATWQATAPPNQDTIDQVRAKASEALKLAEMSGNDSVFFESLVLLGRLYRAGVGVDFLDRCLDETEQDSIYRLGCLAAKAEAKAASASPNPQEVFRLLDEARILAESARNPWSLISVRQSRARSLWQLGERDEAIAEGQNLLSLLEEHYSRQPASSGRAQMISVWREAFQWQAGRLLSRGNASEVDVDRAFEAIERARARALLALREAKRSGEVLPAAETTRLLEMNDLQRSVTELRLWKLGDQLGSAAEAKAAELEEKLGELEAKKRELEYRLERSRPVAPPGPVVSIDEVQADLARDEALMVFQYASDRDLFGRFNGGSWAIVVTKQSRRAYRVAGRLTVERKIDSLATSKDPEDSHYRQQLYDDLLADIVRGLPHRVGKLIILPDGELHRLPFELLRPALDRAPLISRYQISYAPSATLWLRSRRNLHRPAEQPALVLADPTWFAEEGASTTLAGFFRRGELPPLPAARKAGREIVRLLPGSRLVVGEQASEDLLYRTALRRYSIVHIAAHARADDDFPGRSTVYLAHGVNEDGFLQPHEIAALDLEDRLVVLATCESAKGRLMRGEGLLSLSRAFFEAGARAVIGSRRRLSDGEAAELFKIFYDRLGRGASVGEALSAAQRQLLEDGALSRTWSSVVVSGDADLVPFPGGLERERPQGHGLTED